MPFYRQLAVYLMIAVFFNTAIGVPLHAAEHVKGAGAWVQGNPRAGVQAAGQGAARGAAQAATQAAAQVAAQAAAQATPSSELAELTTPSPNAALPALERETPDSRPDAHTTAESCAVCAAHTHQATAFVIWPMAPPAAPAWLCDLPSYVSPDIAEAGQWPFAARDPPRA